MTAASVLRRLLALAALVILAGSVGGYIAVRVAW